MTQTLTTERMEEIAKLATRLHHISGCAAVTSSGETVMHYTHLDEILSALHDVTAELLANREAQPVAVTQFTPVADLYAVRIFGNASAYVRDAAEALRISERNDNAEIVEYVHIKRLQDAYTAPPAPAVPECFLNAFSALESLYRNGQKQSWNERYTTDMAYAAGVITACRAAMLAAVPEGGNGQN